MMNEGDFEVKHGYQKYFETPKHKVDILKQQLNDLISAHVRKDQYSLSMNHPQSQHKTFRARVQYNSPANGLKVYQELKYIDINEEVVNVVSSYGRILIDCIGYTGLVS